MRNLDDPTRDHSDPSTEAIAGPQDPGAVGNGKKHESNNAMQSSVKSIQPAYLGTDLSIWIRIAEPNRAQTETDSITGALLHTPVVHRYFRTPLESKHRNTADQY